MMITKDGNVIIHKKTWETLKNDEYYKEITEEVEDLESHYESMKDKGKILFKDYLKKRKKNV